MKLCDTVLRFRFRLSAVLGKTASFPPKISIGSDACFEIQISGFGFRVPVFGFRVYVRFGIRDQDIGFRVQGVC